MKALLHAVNTLHGHLVFARRVEVLAEMLAALIPEGASVLDVGCGNGAIARRIQDRKPNVKVIGLEVHSRPSCLIPYQTYDGKHFPLPDGIVDMCMFVDVLHHTPNVCEIFREATRVTRRYVLIKDHLFDNQIDIAILKFMDWVGNRPHGVRLPFNYLSQRQWSELFEDAGLVPVTLTHRIPLYSFPFNLAFGRKLHFVALLEKVAT
jgi:SAM-dependent methyltransferase